MAEALNVIASLALLVMTLPIAKAMHHRGFWLQRVTLWLLTLLLGLQAVAPLWVGMPGANPIQAAFTALLAVLAFTTRRQIMAAVRLSVGVEAVDSEHPFRRARDIEDELKLAGVSGGRVSTY